MTEDECKCKKQINQINRSKEKKAFCYCLTQDHPVSFHCQLLCPTLSSCSTPLSLDQLLTWLKPRAPTSLVLKTQCGKDIQHYKRHFASLRRVSSTPFVHMRSFSFRSQHTSLVQPAVARGGAQQQPWLQRNMHSICCKGACNLFTVIYSPGGTLENTAEMEPCLTGGTSAPACLSLPLSRSHILGLGIT